MTSRKDNVECTFVQEKSMQSSDSFHSSGLGSLIVDAWCEICGKYVETIYVSCKGVCAGCGKIRVNCSGD